VQKISGGPVVQLLAHGATDVGRKRDHNEDRIVCDTELGLFAVCDGMGGHAAGEVAAEMVIDALVKAIGDAKSQNVLADPEKESERLGDVLEQAMQDANKAVNDFAQDQGHARGMGTTATAVVVHNSFATVCHVGDSRCYLVRDNRLYQLSDDHSWVAEMVRLGRMTEAEALRSPQRNLLVRSVGTQPVVKVDRLPIELVGGDSLLVCSDGLHSYFATASELVETVGRGEVDQLPRDLVSLACSRGGHDNISAVVLRMVPSEDGPQDARDPKQELTLLGRLQLFAQFELAELVRIRGAASSIAFGDGEYVTKIGDKGDALYVLITGKAVVTAHDEVLTTLQSGAHVGEMAMVDAQPRSASVISMGESHWLRVARQDIFRIVRQHPELAVKLLWNLVRVLSNRLRQTNASLQQRGDQLRDIRRQLNLEESDEDLPILEDPDGMILVEDDTLTESLVQIERTEGGGIDILLDIQKG
jgi:serine/threonine protein phosphatase PrpC/CRP-like cAMP-binding protein